MLYFNEKLTMSGTDSVFQRRAFLNCPNPARGAGRGANQCLKVKVFFFFREKAFKRSDQTTKITVKINIASNYIFSTDVAF